MERRGKVKAPFYNRFQKLKKRYGLSPADYEELLCKQKGKCLICGYVPSSPGKYLVVDHCHSSKDVRGLLCQWCNKGLGFFKDSPKFLRAAIKYLTKQVRSGIIKRQPAKRSSPRRD